MLEDGTDEAIVAGVQRMISAGFEARRAWTTALFYTQGSPARKAFNHDTYGVAGVSSFGRHLSSAPTTWFAGARGTFPKVRMLAHAKKTFDAWNKFDRPASKLVQDALHKLVTPFAHDARSGAKAEGGAKVFCLASPWQMLRAIPYNVLNRDASIKAIGNVLWPGSNGFNAVWLEQGQPVIQYPTCCTYGIRTDESLDGPREYFMTLDVDAINALSKIQETGDKLRRKQLCEEVMDLFTESRGDDDPALLSRLTAILKDAFKQLSDVAVEVSWHKTCGYKPSWRAYVVGVAFRDIMDAKAFVKECIEDRCAQMFLEHLPEPFRSSGRVHKIVDCGTYSNGWDRSLGSAKLNSEDPTNMRFLSVQPLAILTDPALWDLFSQCPNRYILTVLGWMYSKAVYDGSMDRSTFILSRVQTLPPTLKSKQCNGLKRKINQIGTSEPLLPAQSTRLASAIANSFKAHGLVRPDDPSKMWLGENGSFDKDRDTFDIRGAASEFMLCSYRNCGKKPHQPPICEIAQYNPSSELHSAQSGGKMNYTVRVQKLDGRSWILQNCFKCGGSFGYKMQFLCPVVFPNGFGSFREYVLGDTTVADTSQDNLKDLFIPNIYVVRNGIAVRLIA
jgi:hypothetical protein